MVWARQYCACAILVRTAQGFLLYELGAIFNSLNDPGEICTCVANLVFCNRGKNTRRLLMC